MKTSKNHKIILSVAVFFLAAASVYAYPPDNAAVLYYKASVLYNNVDDELKEMVADFQKGEIELNDEIKMFVKTKRRIINTVLDASEVKNCDWGIDFSQGFAAVMPHLSKMRQLSYLVIADAKILTADEDYETALSRCMNLYKMARHINERTFVSYLVGIAINGMTNNCVNQIMSDMPQDVQSLTGLKNQLAEIDSIPLSVKPAVLGEREVILGTMTLEQIPEIVRLCDPNESLKEKILSLNQNEIERNRKYSNDYFAGIIAGFDMPYVEGHAALKRLEKKIEKDAMKNTDAILTGILAPATYRIFSLSTRFETHNNAIKTAIELYMIKAKTGKLPNSLPAGLPGDLFSGKHFEYEKTSDGFILRCQGKDLDKDKVYEYEFKIKK